MSVFLWILQIVLALMFIGIGGQRLVRREAQLKRLPWTDGYPPAAIRTLGVAELVAGLCLLVPGLFGWAPVLTPLAGAGLVVLMALAVVMHLRRGERQAAILPAILLVMSGTVVWGRLDQML